MIESLVVRECIEQCAPEDRALLANLTVWAEENDDVMLSVLAAPAFIELKLQLPNGLSSFVAELNDIAELAPQESGVRLVANALALSADVLARDPGQLATQIIARMRGSVGSLTDLLVANLAREYEGAMVPLTTGLVGAQQAFLSQRVSDSEVKAMAASPTSRWAAVLNASGGVVLIEALPHQLHVRATIVCPGASALAFVPDGGHIVATSNNGDLWVIELASRTCVTRARIEADTVLVGCMDRHCVVLEGECGLSVIRLDEDGRSGTLAAVKVPRTLISARALDFKRRQIVTGTSNGRVDAWDSTSGALERRVGWFGAFEADFEDQSSAALIHGLLQGRFWVSSEDGAKKIDPQELLAHIAGDKTNAHAVNDLRDDPLRYSVRSLAVDWDSQYIAAVAHGSLRLWDISSGQRLANIDGLAGGDPILAFDFQRRVLCAASRDEVLLWSLPLLESTKRVRLPRSDLKTVCCPKESQLILAAFAEGTVVGLNPDLTADAALRADVAAAIRELGWCNDEGDFWLARSSGHIEQWRLDTLRCEQQLPTIFGDLSCVHLSDDGRRMVASAGDAVVVTDVATGLPLFHVPVALDAPRAQLARACVSRSGTRVVVEPRSDHLGALLGAQGKVVLIEMDSGRTTVLEQAAGQVHDLLVSYDGRYAVAVLKTLRQHGETSGNRVRLNLWSLEACETVLQLDFSHHVSCAFSAARRSILWYHDGTLHELGVDRLDANPLVRHVGEPWESFAVDDAGFLIARCEYRRTEVFRVEDLSMVGAFDTDRAIRSVRVVANQCLVLACDEDGAFYAFRCPAIGARPHELKESTNSLSLSGVEGSTQALYEIGRTFGRAEPRESAMALLQLARAKDVSPVFMLGVANLLYEVSEGEQAEALVQSAFSKGDASTQERAVDLLKKRGGSRGLQIVLSSISTAYLLQDACREAIARKDAQTLEMFSRRGRSALTRLIAAQALASLEPGLSAQALSEILVDKEVEGAVQVTAWISMGAVIDRREWLKSLHYSGRVDSWDVNLRVAAAWEVVGAFRTPFIILAARPANEAAPLPIEPIRRALAWDQIAVFYNMLRQTDAALGACSRAIEMRPNAARYRYTRGMVYLTQARQLSPARSSSDLVPQRQDLIRLAISDLSAAIALDPNYDAAWSQRGYAYLELEESELAIHDIKKALELGVSDYAEYRNLAAALSQLGRTREAEEAERRADRLRSNEELGFDHHARVSPARMRAGDDMDEPEGEDQELRTSAVLGALAVLGVTDLIRKRLRELAFSKDFSDEFRAVFADAYVSLAPQQHPVKSQPGGKTFWSRLKQAWRGQKDPDSASDLMQIVIDPLLPNESRSQAAHSLLKKGGIQAAVEILHKLQDTEPSDDDIPEGVEVALATIKALAGLSGGIDALRVLTRDTTAPAMVREIAAEFIGSHVSPIEGITALNALATTLPNGHPVQRYTLNAIDHYESQLRESSRAQAGSPDDRAIDAFFKANSMAELEELAKKDGVFFDRRFVQMLERSADNVPADQRPRYMRNLEWIRALPVNAEILAWRAFEDAISLESMRDASRLHPLLESRHFRAEVERIIAEIRNNLELASALRRRLEWLRQIPESNALGPNGSFRATPVTSVGRNDPCPCGSGKKYKVCHGRLA